MGIALLPADALVRATAGYTEIVRTAASAPLDTPTPCAGWDLGALVRHLLHWSPFLAAAGRRAVPVPIGASEQDVDLTGWPAALETAGADVAAAWSDPAAWEGTTSMGASDPMPAGTIGGMVLGELVMHGWDLARSAGTRPDWPAEVLNAAHDAVVGMAEQGREMGLFGPEVPLPATAPLLDRTVALTGRRPAWTP
jgi:uncharacterized protein (TIGR03086 family)